MGLTVSKRVSYSEEMLSFRAFNVKKNITSNTAISSEHEEGGASEGEDGDEKSAGT